MSEHELKVQIFNGPHWRFITDLMNQALEKKDQLSVKDGNLNTKNESFREKKEFKQWGRNWAELKVRFWKVQSKKGWDRWLSDYSTFKSGCKIWKDEEEHELLKELMSEHLRGLWKETFKNPVQEGVMVLNWNEHHWNGWIKKIENERGVWQRNWINKKIAPVAQSLLQKVMLDFVKTTSAFSEAGRRHQLIIAQYNAWASQHELNLWSGKVIFNEILMDNLKRLKILIDKESFWKGYLCSSERVTNLNDESYFRESENPFKSHESMHPNWVDDDWKTALDLWELLDLIRVEKKLPDDYLTPQEIEKQNKITDLQSQQMESIARLIKWNQELTEKSSWTCIQYWGSLTINDRISMIRTMMSLRKERESNAKLIMNPLVIRGRIATFNEELFESVIQKAELSETLAIQQKNLEAGQEKSERRTSIRL